MRIILLTAFLLLSIDAYAEEPKSVLYNWTKHCKKCHGEDGVATKIGVRMKSPENIYDAMKEKSIEEIFQSIRDGKKKMPSFKKKLTEQEMRELAIHIEYSSLVKSVLDKRGRVEKELNDIRNDYKILPECENGL